MFRHISIEISSLITSYMYSDFISFRGAHFPVGLQCIEYIRHLARFIVMPAMPCKQNAQITPPIAYWLFPHHEFFSHHNYMPYRRAILHSSACFIILAILKFHRFCLLIISRKKFRAISRVSVLPLLYISLITSDLILIAITTAKVLTIIYLRYGDYSATGDTGHTGVFHWLQRVDLLLHAILLSNIYYLQNFPLSRLMRPPLRRRTDLILGFNRK
jgi:hypothetical protein